MRAHGQKMIIKTFQEEIVLRKPKSKFLRIIEIQKY